MAVAGPFTPEEYQLANQVPLSRELYAAAQVQAIGALDWFGHDVMVPVLGTLIGGKSDRSSSWWAVSLGRFFRPLEQLPLIP